MTRARRPRKPYRAAASENSLPSAECGNNCWRRPCPANHRISRHCAFEAWPLSGEYRALGRRVIIVGRAAEGAALAAIKSSSRHRYGEKHVSVLVAPAPAAPRRYNIFGFNGMRMKRAHSGSRSTSLVGCCCGVADVTAAAAPIICRPIAAAHYLFFCCASCGRWPSSSRVASWSLARGINCCM